MDNVIKSVLDGNWESLTKQVEMAASDKIMERVKNQKISILAKLNGTTVEKQQEAMSVA